MVTDHFFSTLCISDLIHLQSIRCTYFPRRMKVTRSTGKCFLLAFAWWVFILYPIGNCWFGPGCISEAKQQPLLTSVAEKTQGSFSLCPANNTMGFRKGVKLLRLSLRSQRTRREVTEKAWKGGWMKLQLEPHKSNTVESQQSGEQSRRGEQCDISRPFRTEVRAWAYNTQSSHSQPSSAQRGKLEKSWDQSPSWHPSNLALFYFQALSASLS